MEKSATRSEMLSAVRRLSGAIVDVLKRRPKRMHAKVVSTALSRNTVPKSFTSLSFASSSPLFSN